MHLVVVTRRPDPLELAIERLAARTAVTPYEARTRLAGGEMPRVVATLAAANDAAALARGLATDAFVARVLPASQIAHDEDRDLVTTLAFGPEALEVTARGGAVRVVPYTSIALVLHGARNSSSTHTTEEKTQKFSAGRALLTGGLVTRSTSTTTKTETRERREAFVYAYAPDGAPIALYERGVNYAFLGARLAPSSLANFNTVLAEIKRRATRAAFDDRLIRPVGLGAVPLPPPSVDPGEWKSDVAAAVLALALFPAT